MANNVEADVWIEATALPRWQIDLTAVLYWTAKRGVPKHKIEHTFYKLGVRNCGTCGPKMANRLAAELRML